MTPKNQEVQSLWDQKAEFWDGLMGETGNLFQRRLVNPAAERLLEVQPGQAILDLACGNGVFARRLAALGAKVVAVDFSPQMIELARQHGGEIDYRVVDATDESALLALGYFDSVVCNMAIMDMVDICPMLRAVRRMLHPGGRFVFTLTHPCFNSNAVRLGIEQEDREGMLLETCYLKVTDYLNIPPGKGMGAPGEPNPHYYFHHTLSALLGACFQAGFMMDGIEEPAFEEEIPGKRALSWLDFKKIPPVLAARMR